MTISQFLQIGVQHFSEGRLMNAEAIFRQILAVDPYYADALYFMGLLANRVARYEEAIDFFRRATGANPHAEHYYLDLGSALFALGRLEEAMAAFRTPLKFNPNYAMAHNNLGAALKSAGRLSEAIESYRNALRIEPNNPNFLNNLAVAQQESGQFTEAEISCRHALRIARPHAAAAFNLGIALHHQGRLREAVLAYREVPQESPYYLHAVTNLAAALRQAGNFDDAIAAYRTALGLKPNLASIHNDLGSVLKLRGLLDEAVAEYHRALQLEPRYTEAKSNLGLTLLAEGRMDDAVAALRQATSVEGSPAWVHSNLICSLLLHPGFGAREREEEQQRWNARFCAPLQCLRPVHGNDRTSERKLRIGYVSPDFRDHVIGRNLLPLFSHHDHRSFEIICYSGVVCPDDLTNKFRELSGQWRNTIGWGDDALAQVIRQDSIDILVDLTQHLEGNRLLVFARKPAPIQVSFAGYPESTGLETIGYRFSDRHLIGRTLGSETLRGEQLHLLESFWCYDPVGIDLPVNELPATSGRVTFGCLNNYCKVTEAALKLWANVLRRVENSRLVILCAIGSHRQRAVEVLEREGIAAERVEFAEPCARDKYLQIYQGVDVALDTFPYNGHTTSLDALWMGVPVVTLAGEAAVSRAGVSQLSNLGLPELIAGTEAEFVEIATGLATHRERLAELRSTLRDRMQRSVLMDAPRFAKQIENGYREMWRRERAQ